jgi:methane/ammonia monooxygenase subunit B
MRKTILGKSICFIGSIFSAAAILVGDCSFVMAHGERAQEPYLRTRTAHWYDVSWSTDSVKVNEDLVVTAKFRLFDDWPDAVNDPDVVFVTNGTPGPVFVRVESYLNGVPARQSFRDLEIGKDYEYKMVLRGRIPGKHHVHPMISISGSGPLVGPGKWIEVNGSASDFVFPVTTISGEKIENLENWGVKDLVIWHLILVAIAAAWLLWWVRRPLLVPRYSALQKGREDLLITTLDVKVGLGLMVLVIVLVFGGYRWASAKYPQTVPLQSGRMYAPPLPYTPSPVNATVSRAEYDVPGRSMRLTLEIQNTGDRAVSIGEFTSANLRFVNRESSFGVKGISADYPQDLIARNGLVLSDNSSIAPGERRSINVEATDSAWETERLTSFLTDVDSKFGALLFFFDDQGKRMITNISGPILPVFQGT